MMVERVSRYYALMATDETAEIWMIGRSALGRPLRRHILNIIPVFFLSRAVSNCIINPSNAEDTFVQGTMMQRFLKTI